MARTAIRNATVIDVIRGDIVENARVIIEGRRIAAIESESTPGVGSNDEELDGEGLWLIPGLMNLHEHLMLREVQGQPHDYMLESVVDHTVTAVKNTENAIVRGWTTVVDMASTHGISIRMRELIRAGLVKGPRVLAAGSPISITGGHAHAICVEADGPEECRAAARGQLKAGADFLKIMASEDPYDMPGPEASRPEMSPEEISAIVMEARRWGKFTAAHVMGEEAIGNVIDSGVRIINHGGYMTEDLATRALDAGCYFGPTLSSYTVRTVDPATNRGSTWIEAHLPLVEPVRDGARTGIAVGLPIVVATDTVGVYSEEVRLLQDLGVSPMDTMRACTINGARAIRRERDLGSIEADKIADMVLLRSNPLDDPQALDDVALVIRDGEVVHRAMP